MAEEVQVVEVKRAEYKKSSTIMRGQISAMDGATDKLNASMYEAAKAIFMEAVAAHFAECEAKLYAGNPALG